MVKGNEKTAYLSFILWKMEIKVWRNNLFTETQLANGSPGRGLTLECADPISSCEEKENVFITLIQIGVYLLFLLVYLTEKLNSLSSACQHPRSSPASQCTALLQPGERVLQICNLLGYMISLSLSLSLLYIALAFLVFNSQRHKETSDIIDNYLLILTWSSQP